MDTIEWFRSVTGDDSVNGVAIKAGVNQPTLARQLQRGVVGHENMVAIARAYGEDPVEALIVSGLILERDVERHGSLGKLSDLDDREIVEEVFGRMQRHAEVSAPSSGRTGFLVIDGAAEQDALASIAEEDVAVARAAKEYPGWQEETDQ